MLKTIIAEDLTRLEGSKSIVWDFFVFPRKDGKYIEPDKKKRTEVHCQSCKQILKYSGNTTNPRFHLDSHHCKEFKEA